MHAFLMELDLKECSNLQMSIKGILIALLLPVIGLAQLPTTNIYHLKLTKVGKSYRVKSPQFMTAFNKNGYNNQPAFFDDKVVYFTTDYYDSVQTEIAKFDLFDKSLTRITYTEEKEYSPTPVPGRDAFSVVRVELDDKVQTLSLYPLDGIGYAKRYMNNTKNIGYHCWLDESTLGLFLVESPHHNLAVADAQSERRKIILDNVGRCLKSDRDGNLLFVHKQSDNEWIIKSYNLESNKSKTIIQLPNGVEDYEVLNDGTFLIGQGSTLSTFNPKSDTEWVKVIDLGEAGITNIKRVAARRNSLILVNEG